MIEEHKPENAGTAPTKDLIWLVSCSLITAVAAFMRFFWLDLKPLHHDEGVNGFFLTTLFREGTYKYDPANYHGPTLYYIALGFTKIFGLETIPIRWSVAIFGVLTVILAFFLRPYIGKLGSLFAALFLALSPGMVFISRYFIHEIIFVFLSLAVVLSLLYFLDRRKAGPFAVGWFALLLLVCFLPSTLSLAAAIGRDNATLVWVLRAAFFLVELVLVFLVIRMLLAWDNGRPVYFLLAAASVALLFTTKETAFITLGTMLISIGCVQIWQRLRRTSLIDDEFTGANLNWRSFRSAMGNNTDLILLLAAAAAVVVYITVLFFSSFFTYPEGLKGFVEAYALWTKTGSKDHTQNGFWAYLKWGMEIEAPIFILSATGIAIAFIKARHRFAMFAGLWAFGLLAAYSIIPYKTPWLSLSFLLPMCIAAGYAINEIARAGSTVWKTAALILGLGAAGVLAYQSYDLNFVRYDDEEMPYVYAHTRREFLEMMRQIDLYAEKSGKSKDAVIQIVSPDYWPMVWYVRDYSKANFHSSTVDAANAEIIVAKKREQDADVIRLYSANYAYVGTYPLRPGVDLVLLVRKDLAEPGGKELYRIKED